MFRSGFKTFNQVKESRQSEGFKRRNIFNISSIEFLAQTQKLALSQDFEIIYNTDNKSKCFSDTISSQDDYRI
jgi:hypothetical protein